MNICCVKKTVLAFLFFSYSLWANQAEFIRSLAKHVVVSAEHYENLLEFATTAKKSFAVEDFESDHNILFEQYPELKNHIPYIKLSSGPTPVRELEDLSVANQGKVYMKMDGYTGRKTGDTQWFGGNKVRKLEFLLADALQKGARSIVTMGALGSNHVVATASCCKQLGLGCHAFLTPQPITDVVERNYSLMHQYDAKITKASTKQERDQQTVEAYLESQRKKGETPYFIPTGGSNPLGILGYIEGLSELCEQILEEQIEEPDVMYVACGTGGTAAGLLLGLRVIGLDEMKLKIVAIEPDNVSHTMKKRIFKLFHEANELLHKFDPTIEKYDLTENDIDITFAYHGGEYGVVSPQAQEAIDYMLKTHAIKLDPTYTAKAFAAFKDDIKKGKVKGKNVLFWNTFCEHVEPQHKVALQNMQGSTDKKRTTQPHPRREKKAKSIALHLFGPSIGESSHQANGAYATNP